MLKRSLIASAVALTISAAHAHAAWPFATIYSFGDSLSTWGTCTSRRAKLGQPTLTPTASSAMVQSGCRTSRRGWAFRR
jgi:phospholipase/lecithinase/hemolysin